MAFLSDEDFEEKIEMAESTQEGSKNALRLFEKFCKTRDTPTIQDAIEEMKVAPHKKMIFKALQSWIRWLIKNDYSASTIPIYYSYLRSHLYDNGIEITEQDRKKNIKFPTIPEEEKHPLSLEEIKKIFAVASFRRKTMYLAMLSSSMRIGEAVQLRKSDLKLVKNRYMITIRSETTKKKKGRTTFMSREATRLVQSIISQIKDNDLIFGTSENVRASRTNETIRFREYTVKVGLDQKYSKSKTYKITLHSFRAYFITKMSRIDENLAKKLSGQKGYMLQYDRLENDEKLDIYLKAEPELFIYENKPESEAIQTLREELKEVKTGLQVFSTMQGIIQNSAVIDNPLAQETKKQLLKIKSKEEIREQIDKDIQKTVKLLYI